jgi:hypothetical protein
VAGGWDPLAWEDEEAAGECCQDGQSDDQSWDLLQKREKGLGVAKSLPKFTQHGAGANL